jgi:Domain of unknown function (DUF4157)
VHSDADSAKAAEALQARAFTVGQEIHFAHDACRPESPADGLLLAHEVAHAAQHSLAGDTSARLIAPDHPAESQADTIAQRLLQGEPAQVSGASGLARQPAAKSMDFPGFRFPSTRDQYNPDGSKKMSSRDGYHREVNWTTFHTVPEPIPDDPPSSVSIPRQSPGAAPIGFERVHWITGNMLIPPGLYDKRVQSYQALHECAFTIESSWAAMAPQVSAYSKASDEIREGGALGPAPEGENWNPVSPGAKTYDQAAGEQKVGTKTKLADVFKDKEGKPVDAVTGIDQKAVQAGSAQDREAVSRLFEQAKFADKDVDSAVRAYHTHVNKTMAVAANNIKIAMNNIDLKAKGEDEKRAAEKKAELEKQRKEATDQVDTAVKWLTKIGKVTASGGEGAAETAGEAAGVLANAIIGGQYDAEIREATQALLAARGVVGHIQDDNLRLAHDNARKNYQAQEDAVPDKKLGIQKALSNRKDKYAAAAKAAGAKAGGGEKGERIQAAIEAIPRVETVVGRINAVTSNIHLPTYTPLAGTQFSAATMNDVKNFDTGAFLKWYWQLGSYNLKFQALKTQWDARLTSLRKLVAQFNVPGK